MNVTNIAPAAVRTPTVQPELWQPGESRDLPDEIARALAHSAHFAAATDTIASVLGGSSTPDTQPTPTVPAPAEPERPLGINPLAPPAGQPAL